MKKKNAIILCTVLALIIVCSICVVSFGDEISFLKSLGISSRQSDDTVLAEYKGFKVTQGMVNFQKRAANLAGDNPNVEACDYTKDAIIDRLLTGRMLVEEAESRGATAEELLALVGRGRPKRGIFEGDLDEGELEIGQIAALIDDLPSAGDILRRLVAEYETARGNLRPL